MPDAHIDEIFAREPPHLYLGEVEREDGSHVPGVLCETKAAFQHPEVTGYGGWHAWRKHMDNVA